MEEVDIKKKVIATVSISEHMDHLDGGYQLESSAQSLLNISELQMSQGRVPRATFS